MSIAIPSTSPETDFTGIEPPRIVLRPLLNLDDDQFFQLCVQNPEQPLEQNAQGDLILVSPQGLLLNSQIVNIICQLKSWDREEKCGITFSSRTPFRLSNDSVRRPDAAWVERSRWDRLTQNQKEAIARLCPNFVIEVRSETNPLGYLQGKLVEYLDNGVELGWIVDPLLAQVHVYEQGQPMRLLDHPATVAGTGCVDGFVLDLKGIFPAAD